MSSSPRTESTRGAPTGAPHDAPADDALLAAYLAGDVASFEMLYNRYKGPLYRFFLRQLAEADAHDAFQTTWSKLLKAAPKYKPANKFQAFLFTLAHNVIMDTHRGHMRLVTGIPPEPASEPLEAESARAQLSAKLHQEIAKLPIQQRTAWMLQQESDLSLHDIARLTQSSVEGVKSRLRYAREALKAGMQKYVRT